LDCATSSVRDCAYNVPTCEDCPSRPADASGNCAVGNPTLGGSFPIQSYIFTCPIVCNNAVPHNGGELSSSGTNLTSHNTGSGGHATMESGQVSSGITIIFNMFVVIGVLLFAF
jgi:hypothetical protein